jgi:ergothioneine biosynthesis protein EgtB
VSGTEVKAKDDTAALAAQFRDERAMTLALAAPLSAEDQQSQSMLLTSPTKWHLAHTTWFFETFVLGRPGSRYRVFDPGYHYLFNSYYEALGERHPRPDRGLLTRPPLDDIRRYRHHVDRAVEDFLAGAPDSEAATLIELGCHHEQQHQELILTDIKHLLSLNMLAPAYRSDAPLPQTSGASPMGWVSFDGGVTEIGHDSESFCFDNELPRHKVWLDGFRLADRPVTNREWLEFITDGGYTTATLWLSDGWQTVRAENWQAPLHWRRGKDDTWSEFTLAGLRPLDPEAPVAHVSYYEADAFARWAGHRLPSEAEWEIAAATVPITGNFLESGLLHPCNRPEKGGLRQMFGDVWEWTQSPYTPYPGFQPAHGAVGEYNGKFMSNQMVLRGGSCATPRTHIRAAYRNFFPPSARWQFSGLRLAADA